MPIPSVGRVVHYKAYGTPGGEHKSVPRAAIVTEVVDIQPVNGTAIVHLAVVNPTGLFFNLNVKQGDGPGQWNWPPFVPQSETK
jgi:hypothetical protein